MNPDPESGGPIGSPSPATLAVVIPTRSRPDRLARCLDSLAAAREHSDFAVYVCDSSPSEEMREAVRQVCERYPWTHLSLHQGTNAAAARNACASVASEDLLINVDDDLELEPRAIERLLRRYEGGVGRRVVAGSVYFEEIWSTPVKERAIGYGRPARPDEDPDFIISAFFLYPRAFALAWPWNDRIDRDEDIFMGALWRSHGVQILFADDARAVHEDLPLSSDPARLAETVRHQCSHIYSLLFDSLIANPNPIRALAYETLGFAATAKLYVRRRALALPFLHSWLRGHFLLVRDIGYLRRLVRTELESSMQPGSPATRTFDDVAT